jgi:cell division protein FtsZ
MAQAEEGIKELKENVDALVIIPNDKLLEISQQRTTLMEAFKMADDVLRQGVQGITDLILSPGLLNQDFANVRSVMKDAGFAHMGVGRSSSENKAIDAAKLAVHSPLLETTIEGAKGVILNITGSPNMTMYDASEAANYVQELIDPEALFIFGSIVDENLKDEIVITVIATGFDEEENEDEAVVVRSTAQVATTPSTNKQPQVRVGAIPIPDAADSESGTDKVAAFATASAPTFPTYDDFANEDIDIPDFLKRNLD